MCPDLLSIQAQQGHVTVVSKQKLFAVEKLRSDEVELIFMHRLGQSYNVRSHSFILPNISELA